MKLLFTGLFIALLVTLVAFSVEVRAGGQCITPLWQDEFDGTQLDATRWRVEEGDGCDRALCGWGNNEQQWYRADNIAVADGELIITAKRHAFRQADAFKQADFTSGRLTSAGLFAQQYGRFEARMKLPSSMGLWPAFWMMPDNMQQKWPLEGEIDILEKGGADPRDAYKILGAIHFGDQWPGNRHYSESLLVPVPWSDEFHTYRVDWQPDLIRWSVDDKVFGEVRPIDIAPYRWVFNDKPFHLILNLAVGGTLGGEVPEAFSEAELRVDYVRVYGVCE